MSADEQTERLHAIAGERGWMVIQTFIDRPAAVKKDRRPGELALIEAIRSGGVEKVLIFGIDRVGRSLTDLVTFMEVCRTAGVSLWLDEQQLDTAASNGLPLFNLTEMMAFHLRQTRRDRILRGQAAVRGIVRFGRPPIAKAKLMRAKQELAAGKGDDRLHDWRASRPRQSAGSRAQWQCRIASEAHRAEESHPVAASMSSHFNARLLHVALRPIAVRASGSRNDGGFGNDGSSRLTRTS